MEGRRPRSEATMMASQTNQTITASILWQQRAQNILAIIA
jgi:hypothetical protein